MLRKYSVVYSAARRDWELHRFAADETSELVERYPSRNAAVRGCKQHCGRQLRAGWVADLFAYDCDGRLAFEQLFEPGLIV